jgi:hypothetical protein
MDLSLKTLISSLASNLLSPSASFEPYIPNSKQNLYYSLNLLSELGGLTQTSLESEYPEPVVEAPSVPKFEPLSPRQKLEHLTPQQELKALPPLQKQNNPGSKSSNPLLKRCKDVDQSLLQALQTLRESKQFQRKTMGVFSPVLRGNS